MTLRRPAMLATGLWVFLLLVAGCGPRDPEKASPAEPSPDKAAFDRSLKEHKVVLVDFHATWCGPCRMMDPVVQELKKAYQGKVQVVKVDVDESPELAQHYQVMSIPRFLIFKDGEVVKAFSGARPRAELENALRSVLAE